MNWYFIFDPMKDTMVDVSIAPEWASGTQTRINVDEDVVGTVNALDFEDARVKALNVAHDFCRYII